MLSPEQTGGEAVHQLVLKQSEEEVKEEVEEVKEKKEVVKVEELEFVMENEVVVVAVAVAEEEEELKVIKKLVDLLLLSHL